MAVAPYRDACTTDVCTAVVCSNTQSGACEVTGIVRYYRDGAGSSEPSIKPVPSVEIDGTQDLAADDVTDATGSYGLPNLFGNVAVTTLPTFGSPRVSDHNGAITSFDAARVAQYAVALIDHFDVAVSTGSDWKLFRCDTYTSAGSQNCGSPQYVFAPLNGAQTANFYAVLYGDVTGNWTPAALAAARAAGSLDKGEATMAHADAERAAVLRASGVVPAAPRPSREGAAVLSLTGWAGPLSPGERRTLVLDVKNADGIEAIDLALRFDSRNATLVDVKPMDLATGWSVAHRQGEGGAKVALYGVTPLQGSGALLSITIEARTPLSLAPISIEASANEGTIPVRVGRIVVRSID